MPKTRCRFVRAGQSPHPDRRSSAARIYPRCGQRDRRHLPQAAESDPGDVRVPHLAGEESVPVPGYATAFRCMSAPSMRFRAKCRLVRTVARRSCGNSYHKKVVERVSQTGGSPRDPGDGQEPLRTPAILHRSPALGRVRPGSRTFLLEDGISLGALFELTPAGTEARTTEFMTQLRDAIQTALTDAIPEEDDAPGCCRSTCKTNPACRGFRKRSRTTRSRVRRNAIHPALPGHAFPTPRTDYTAGGLFEDKAVTGTHWRDRCVGCAQRLPSLETQRQVAIGNRSKRR